MRKYILIFLLILSIICLTFFWSSYLFSDLIFSLERDNYDILEFTALSDFIFIFLIGVVFILSKLAFLKNYLNKIFINSQIYHQINFTSRLQTRAPPF